MFFANAFHGVPDTGTELSFEREVTCVPRMMRWGAKTINQKTAIFRQINKGWPTAHHDALEFPDGQVVLLTSLTEGQRATVLQLPATSTETKATQEAAYV